METGKKFDFITKKDFKGGMILESVKGSVSDYKAPKSGDVGKVKKEDHKTIKAKSKVPKWLKKTLNETSL
jgi:hypothetical protein